MARCPFTAWHPLGDNPTHQPLIGKVRGIVLHTAVGSLISTDGYFMHGNGEGYIGTESHWIVGGYGEGWQITDTSRTADANLDGNSTLLSIETADTYAPFPPWSGEDVPAWTADQIQTLARIVAWAANEYDFPIARMADSKASTRGVGYHRLGIDSSPPGRLGWRVPGGESWTTTPGKVCPGDRRIAQVDQVIALAKSGAKPPWPQFRERSPAIKAMQTKLAFNGYTTGHDLPGYFGAGTKAAIVRLQRAFDDTKADPDGVIGPLTWAHIEALPDAPKEPPVHDSPLEKWLKSTGDIRDAQRANEPLGQAVVDAQPNRPVLAEVLARQKQRGLDEAVDWAVLHEAATP